MISSGPPGLICVFCCVQVRRCLFAPNPRTANRPDLAEFYRAAAAQPVSEHYPEQLEEARSYAYGGCVIQDIGYYPFGDHSSPT